MWAKVRIFLKKISTIDWRQIFKWKIFSNFVAFSEYLNFKNKNSSSEHISSHCETITHILTTVLPGGPELSHMYSRVQNRIENFICMV